MLEHGVQMSFLTGEERMKKLSYRVLAAALLLAMIIPGPLTGQNTTRPKKVLTPEQAEFQRKVASYMVQRKALQEQAAKAFDAEAAREKAGACKNAGTTRDIETCQEKETELSETNYSAFSGAIRELLSLSYPEFSGPDTSVPTEAPPNAEDLVKEFDALQTAWQQYRKIGTNAAYNQYKGGTLAPVLSAAMSQQLVRSHMRELGSIYDGPLHR
jgi:uncharacterized protein YecT (DUF1311 family)